MQIDKEKLQNHNIQVHIKDLKTGQKHWVNAQTFLNQLQHNLTPKQETKPKKKGILGLLRE
jgi:hypothetical protein